MVPKAPPRGYIRKQPVYSVPASENLFFASGDPQADTVVSPVAPDDLGRWTQAVEW